MKINLFKMTEVLLFVATTFLAQQALAQPPSFNRNFDLGTLTINCTVLTSSNSTANPTSYRTFKTAYTTANLLSELQSTLGTVFPAGSHLEVFFVTPFEPQAFGSDLFFLAAYTNTVVVKSATGQTWDVSSHVQLSLIGITLSNGVPVGLTPDVILLQGQFGNASTTAGTVAAQFIASLKINTAANSLDLGGAVSESVKIAPITSSPNSYSVGTALLMKSGFGSGTHLGQPAIITGQVLINGKSTWSFN
jgi:hypothetical protein